MSRHTKTATLIALVVIAALSGCSASAPSPEPTATAAQPDFVTPVEPAWTADVDLVGQPIYQDGFVASYVAAPDGALNVVAWNAETGAEIWRDVAAVGSATQGVVVSLAGLESGDKSFVTYLSAPIGDDDGWRELVIAEIATGIPTAISNDLVWATRRPSPCADEIAVCFTGFIAEPYNEDRANFRLDPKVGTIVADTDVVIPANARMLNDRLFSTGDRAPDGAEQLGSSANGSTTWLRPYSDIFAEGYSSDAGWSWDLSGTDAAVVGIASYFDTARLATGAGVIDKTQTAAVGLDPATGVTLWKLEGATICAASTIAPELLDDITPLCRYNSGTTTITLGADGLNLESTRTDFDIDLLGVDPISGEVQWTVPLGSASTELAETDVLFETRSAVRPVDVLGTVSLVNALTGEVTDLPSGAIFACLDYRDGFQAPQNGTGEILAYSAGRDVFACSSDQTPTGGTAFSAAAVRMGGVEAGENSYVIGGASGLALYTLTD
ncbi:hypothetical protein [Cryobacterium sp. Y57]|uniref:hypothetical protein n=1 Tax=Cryobacterium sp. Y57 TaxID=2048287 RepID=UPI000CE43218|nr:hypothetical protein [Cryobacterium sp. Y57]